MEPEASKRELWDQRYAASDLVWGAAPNRFVEAEFSGVKPRGRALDLACGEGRNTLWLAQQGWRATGVDFSRVAIERGRQLAARGGIEVELIEADVTRWSPEPATCSLVLVAYLQIPRDDRRRVWAHAAAALAPGGELFAVGHALRNLREGSGGPQDPSVLWDPDELVAELGAVSLAALETEERTRPVDGAERDALDLIVRARMPA